MNKTSIILSTRLHLSYLNYFSWNSSVKLLLLKLHYKLILISISLHDFSFCYIFIFFLENMNVYC